MGVRRVKRNNVLIVEDEKPLLSKMINNIEWENNGFDIYSANSGEKALDILNNNVIDILVTDIKMSGISGIELIEECRQMELSIVPIIISGYAEFEYAQKSIRLNVSDYILKPFQSFRLLEIVKKAADKIKHRREEEKQLGKLQREIKNIIGSKSNIIPANILMKKNIDLYKEQAFLLKNDTLFNDLKISHEEKLMADLDALFSELAEKNLDKMSLAIIINNIILLVFKSVKDLGYDLKDIINKLDFNRELKLNTNGLPEIKNWLSEFLLQINKLITGNPQQKQRNIIKDIENYVKDNFEQGVKLNELAREFNVSSGYLSKLFQKYTGKKFSKYLDDIRISKARELLKTTDYRVYQIADYVGFDDPYYFSSWFKKRVGITPTTYRENLSIIE